MLGEHHEDAAGPTEIGDLAEVLVRPDTAERMIVMLRGDLEGRLEIIDGEGNAVRADVVGTAWIRLDRVGVEVLEEFKATVAVRAPGGRRC